MVSIDYIREVLDNNDKNFIEDLAKKSRNLTLKHFGNTISLYAPLYLSNYCDNQCTYCGFNHSRDIDRTKLTEQEMEKEMQRLASYGIQNVLLLTGESKKYSPPEYIKTAVIIAKKYFSTINLEVFPMEVEDYKMLYEAGADGVTVYQETYDRQRYKELHIKGPKSNYDFRYLTPERIAKAGMRSISMGVLLGLSEIDKDIFSLFNHLEQMERDYPGVEYSLSFPRIIPIKNYKSDLYIADDVTLIKLICLARILFPTVGINLSTREDGVLRDNALRLGITRISAASKTTVGGYSDTKNETPQFDVMDHRSVEEIKNMIKLKGFDPVFTDWRRI